MENIQKDERSAPDFFEEGIKLSLVLGDDTEGVNKLMKVIEDLKYWCILAENTGSAIDKMRLHNFDLVILSDRFDGVELLESPVLHYLNHLSMSIRRHIFLCLIGDQFETMDHMMAFSMSANLVVNWKDINRLMPILKNAISANERFYKVFLETLAEVGKA